MARFASRGIRPRPYASTPPASTTCSATPLAITAARRRPSRMPSRHSVREEQRGPDESARERDKGPVVEHHAHRKTRRSAQERLERRLVVAFERRLRLQALPIAVDGGHRRDAAAFAVRDEAVLRGEA